MAPQALDAPLGIYLHIPFCQHICPYCDFNTYRGQEALIPNYVAALERSIAREGAIHHGRPVQTIYFGGGTPSLLTGEQVDRLIAAVAREFTLEPDVEISLEANPNSADQVRFAEYRAAGVNRLSIGVQTTDRGGLRVLGRNHESFDAERALDAARRAGFANVNLDLIFGWPGQTREQWQQDLTTVLAWGDSPEHLSLYGLIVEPGTPMANAVARGILHPVSDDLSADLYEDAIDLLRDRGWLHYEIANFSCTPELQSRHNRIYWRNGEYLGLGAGAHGRIGAARTINHLLPRTFIAALDAGEDGVANREHLTRGMEMGETMMMGLRLLDEGVVCSEFAKRHGCSLDEVYGNELRDLTQMGLIERSAERVRLTRRGTMLANDVAERFIAVP